MTRKPPAVDPRALAWLERNPEAPRSPDPRVILEALGQYLDTLQPLLAPELAGYHDVEADFFDALARLIRLLDLQPDRPLPPGWERNPDAIKPPVPARGGAPADAEKARRFALLHYMKTGEDPCESCPPLPESERLSWKKLADLCEALGWGSGAAEDYRLHVYQDRRFDRARWKLAAFVAADPPVRGAVSGLHVMAGFHAANAARVAREAIRAFYEAERLRSEACVSKE